jgi:hypothetical protein
MNLSSLTALVRSTPLLSDAERAYWLEHLPTMKPNQCERLETILNSPDEGPFASAITQFFQMLGNDNA